MSHTVSTTSSIFIGRAQAAVFDFVTRPRNWVSTHPVTDDVHFKGGDARAVIGDEYVETIGGAGQPVFDVRWRVSDLMVDRLWTIETVELGDPGVSCRIQYEFRPEGTGTMFVRSMTVNYLDTDGASTPYHVPPEGAADPEVHDQYINAVKQRLESSQ